ncbi:MAG: FAD/NAD(P)-binding oxidoreductase, partial [Pseudomonadota bacterium]
MPAKPTKPKEQRNKTPQTETDSSGLSRRQFTALAAATAATGVLYSPNVARAAKPNVVVIGGGAGGGTAARYIAKDSKGGVNVTLIEPSRRYYTCFYSNLYLGGFRDFESIGHSYDTLANDYGINVVHDMAAKIDKGDRTVELVSGNKVPYDRLVVSPGIDLKYDSVPGYSLAAANLMPHAWKSGTQVQRLKHMVENMREGGTFVMIAPPNPYRCPPGPYERISMIAHILKQKNPSAKIIILDPKEKFSKQGLFQEGWEAHYPGMVEWIPKSIYGELQNVNPETGEITTDFDTFKADAATVIPAQTAGHIAIEADLTNDAGWCAIDPASMRSTKDENIFVLGDASVASAM